MWDDCGQSFQSAVYIKEFYVLKFCSFQTSRALTCYYMELYGRCDCCASQMYTCVTVAVIFLTWLLFLLYANFSHVPSPFLFLYFQIFFSLASGGIQTTSRVIQSTVITFKALSIMLLFQQAFFTTLCIIRPHMASRLGGRPLYRV